MLEKAENYEEAKKIIKYSTEDKETTKRGYGVQLLRWGFLTAVATGLFVGINQGSLCPDIIPISMISIPNLIPVFIYANNRRKIKNGTYFEGKSESTIINEANEYVEWRNALERAGKIK